MGTWHGQPGRAIAINVEVGHVHYLHGFVQRLTRSLCSGAGVDDGTDFVSDLCGLRLRRRCLLLSRAP
jgi:hypothetical protein